MQTVVLDQLTLLEGGRTRQRKRLNGNALPRPWRHPLTLERLSSEAADRLLRVTNRWRMTLATRLAERVSPTGRSGEPLDELLAALSNRGWVADLREPFSGSGGPNPTRVDLRHSQDRRRLLIYSWFITGEGKGRGKDDYRIQTTRTHEGPLMLEPGRVTVGIGWDRQRQVFAAFDGWTKRETGGSSSVHIRRALLDGAADSGSATDGPRWDPRFAFTPEQAGTFLTWVGEMSARREAVINALDYTLFEDDTAEIVGDTWRDAVTWLRVGDRVIVIDADGGLANESLWRVEDLESRSVSTPSGRYNRTHIHFGCRRIGKVNDPKVVKTLQ